jgi:hypothetical protein
MTGSTAHAEWRRLAAATSLEAAFAAHVEDFAALRIDEVPWLADLAVPECWQLAVTPDHRIRIAGYGERPDGGWQACETLSVFGFTGAVPADVLTDTADRMLRELAAIGIRTYAPPTPARPGVAAVRASGHITVAGRSLWVRFNTYTAGSKVSGQGRLVQHGHFVDADSFFGSEPTSEHSPAQSARPFGPQSVPPPMTPTPTDSAVHDTEPRQSPKSFLTTMTDVI